MTQGALNSHRNQFPLLVEVAGYADNRVELEQGQSRGRIVEIDLATFELIDEAGGQGVQVNFQTYGERGLGTYSWTDTAQFFSGDRLVEMQSIAPKGFVAKSVVAKNLLTLLQHLLGIGADHL